MQSRFKQTALFSVKLLLSIAVLAYIARGLDLGRLRTHLVSVDPFLFALALALIFFQTFVLNGRWELIMRALGVSLDWFAGWRILMISLWFNQVLPSSVGGDAVRMWLLRQRGVQWPEAVKGVAADRFTALIGLIVLMAAGLPLLMSRVSNEAAILAIGGLTLAGVAGTVVLLTLDRLPKRLIALPAIASFVRFGTLVRFLLVRSECRGLLLGSALLIHLVTAAACYVLARGGRSAALGAGRRHPDSAGGAVDGCSDLDQRLGRSRGGHGRLPWPCGRSFRGGAVGFAPAGGRQRVHRSCRRRDLAGKSGARLVFRGQGGEGCRRITELRAGEGRGGIEPPLTRLNQFCPSDLHRVGLPHLRASLRFPVPR
ncbi:uncharacterized membrane protein YbhN (UPF0104 family) [Bradyrhizobium diazoefficiens]